MGKILFVCHENKLLSCAHAIPHIKTKTWLNEKQKKSQVFHSHCNLAMPVFYYIETQVQFRVLQ